MALRAFRTTFLIAIDEQDAADLEQRDPDKPVTLEEVKEYLRNYLNLDMNTEDVGGSEEIGFQSVEVNIEALREIPADEVSRLYSK